MRNPDSPNEAVIGILIVLWFGFLFFAIASGAGS